MNQMKLWWKNITKDSSMDNEKVIRPCDPRMYLVVREDLAYKYIQGAHALAKYALDFPNEFKEWNNEYLICLSTFNGLGLESLVGDLYTDDITSDEPMKYKFSMFFEPDLKSELPTALAIF